MKTSNMWRAVFLGSLLFLSGSRAGADSYEASFPLYEGGAEAGFQVLVFTNRDPSTPVDVSVQAVAVERETLKQYAFPVSTATVPPAQLNAVTGELAEAGAALLHFDLKKSGFQNFKRVILRVDVLNPPAAFTPSFSWACFFTARGDARILSWADHRRFRRIP